MPGQSKALVKKTPALDKLGPALKAGKKGKYKQAAELLKDLISSGDAPPEAWLLLGRSLHALKDYYRAIAAYNDYIRQKPNSADGYLFAGRSYLAVSMPYKAVSFLRKALEKSPGSAVAKALLGIAYLKSRNSQAAVQLLEAAVEAAPGNRRIYRAYLNALMIRGIRLNNIEDYQMGLQMLRFVLANGEESGISDSTILRLELGRAARETGCLEEALVHFTAALEIVRRTAVKGTQAVHGDRRIRWLRVSILMALGRNAEARKEIEIIRSTDRDLPELPWNNELVDLFIIRSLLESGEWRKAAGACRDWFRQRKGPKQGTVDGTTAMVHALYAEALRNLGSYEEAHNHIQRALDKAPRELEFWYAGILVSWERMDFKSLKRALRTIEGLDGDQTIISRFKILLRAKTGEDHKAIIKLLQNAIRSLGPEPELMYALGELYLKTGLLEESLNWFKKTLILKEDHQKAQLAGIVALEALLAEDGRRPWAGELASFYERYLESWPANTNIRRERAMFLVKTFDFGRAIPELEKLLALESSNPGLRRLLAYAYRKAGRFREAAVYLNALLRERPWDIELLLEYVGCLERAGSAGYAISMLEMALKAFVDLPKRPKAAGKQAGSGKLQISDISLALGVLHFRQKNTEKAFDHLREAAAAATKDPRPYQWMAEIARKNGDEASYRHFSKEAQNRQKQKK